MRNKQNASHRGEGDHVGGERVGNNKSSHPSVTLASDSSPLWEP